MVKSKLDLGRQFANLTAQIEDALGIAVEGQRSGLSQDEAKVLVQLLQRQMSNISMTCRQIASS